MALLKPCYVDGCGELSDQARCPAHRPKHPNKSRKASGYDHQHQRLRERALAMQPFCLDCGTTEDLQLDHLPIAWRRKAQGKPIRLSDVAVRCGRHNRRAGAARGPSVTRTDQ